MQADLPKISWARSRRCRRLGRLRPELVVKGKLPQMAARLEALAIQDHANLA